MSNIMAKQSHIPPIFYSFFFHEKEILQSYYTSLCTSTCSTCLFASFFSHYCFNIYFIAATCDDNNSENIPKSFKSMHALRMGFISLQCRVWCQEGFLARPGFDVVSAARERERVLCLLAVRSEMRSDGSFVEQERHFALKLRAERDEEVENEYSHFSSLNNGPGPS
jgi:hypothetical protein